MNSNLPFSPSFSLPGIRAHTVTRQGIAIGPPRGRSCDTITAGTWQGPRVDAARWRSGVDGVSWVQGLFLNS